MVRLGLATAVMLLVIAGFALFAMQRHFVPDLKRDHLVPLTLESDNTFDPAPVAKVVFKEAFGFDVRLRESYGSGGLGPRSEHVILLKQNGPHYRIVTLEAAAHFVSYTEGAVHDFGPVGAKSGMPVDYHSIVPRRCEIELPAALAVRAIAAWHGVMLKTHYDSKPASPAMDGAPSYFMMRDDDQILEGWTYGFVNDTEPSLLARTAHEMAQYCEHRDAQTLGALRAAIDALQRS
jgi:hypothetical protein